MLHLAPCHSLSDLIFFQNEVKIKPSPRVAKLNPSPSVTRINLTSSSRINSSGIHSDPPHFPKNPTKSKPVPNSKNLQRISTTATNARTRMNHERRNSHCELKLNGNRRRHWMAATEVNVHRKNKLVVLRSLPVLKKKRKEEKKKKRLQQLNESNWRNWKEESKRLTECEVPVTSFILQWLLRWWQWFYRWFIFYNIFAMWMRV